MSKHTTSQPTSSHREHDQTRPAGVAQSVERVALIISIQCVKMVVKNFFPGVVKPGLGEQGRLTTDGLSDFITFMLSAITSSDHMPWLQILVMGVRDG
jgi:hypothetical protein